MPFGLRWVFGHYGGLTRNSLGREREKREVQAVKSKEIARALQRRVTENQRGRERGKCMEMC